LCLSSDSILYNVFYSTLIHNYTSDDMLRTVFMPHCSAADLMYHLLAVLCRLGCILLFYDYLFSLFVVLLHANKRVHSHTTQFQSQYELCVD